MQSVAQSALGHIYSWDTRWLNWPTGSKASVCQRKYTYSIRPRPGQQHRSSVHHIVYTPNLSNKCMVTAPKATRFSQHAELSSAMLMW